jgi:hypothetical protein
MWRVFKLTQMAAAGTLFIVWDATFSVWLQCRSAQELGIVLDVGCVIVFRVLAVRVDKSQAWFRSHHITDTASAQIDYN